MAENFIEYRTSARDKSSVWQYFLRRVDGAEAKCKYKECQTVLIISGSTSSLHKHLKHKHNIDLKTRQVQNEEAGTSADVALPTSSRSSSSSDTRELREPPKKKTKIDQYFQSNDSMEVTVSKLASLDGFAFNVFCTSKTLRTLFTKSGYKLPASPHTIKKIVVTHSDQIKAELKIEFKSLTSNNCKFTSSLDEWTSEQNVRYLNITIHSPKLAPNGFRNLGLQPIKKKGTADNLLNMYKEKLAQFDLTLNEIIGFVTDGASVMCSMGRKTPAFHQLCYAHGIQLAVLDVLYKTNQIQESTGEEEQTTDTDTDVDIDNADMEVENEEGLIVTQTTRLGRQASPIRLVDTYKELIKKVRTVVKMFRSSPTKSELLYNYDAEGEKKGVHLILDCKTRWSSLADMLSRFMLLKTSVFKSLIDLKSTIMFTEEDICNLEEISETLGVVKATVEAICQQDANLLTAETALKFMIRQLSLKPGRLSINLVTALKNRIAQSQRRQAAINGTIQYLHSPTLFYQAKESEYPFETPSNECVRDTIININNIFFESELEEIIPEHNTLPSTSAAAPMTVKEQLQEEIKKAMLDPLCQSRDSRDSTALDIETQIKVEMALFDSSGKRTEYLQRAYDALLTISPTSVEAEVFSSAGYLCNHLRTRLKVDSLDALSFLRSHYQREGK